VQTTPFSRLQLFLAVARLRSFRSAARELGVSVSAVGPPFNRGPRPRHADRARIPPVDAIELDLAALWATASAATG
jgi:hypothetical protein